MEEWAEPANLPIVLVRLWERRAYGWKTRSHQLEHHNTTLRERLQHAQAALEARRPAMLAHLDKVCREFVASSDFEEKKKLVHQIRNLDGELRVIARGPGLIARIVYLSLRVGLDSVAVGQEIGLGSTFCRQQLHRCRLTWASLNESFLLKAPRVPALAQRRRKAAICAIVDGISAFSSTTYDRISIA